MGNADDKMSDNSLDPWSFLKEWAKNYPQAARIVLGAVACFAAVALVANFGLDLQANIPNVLYILFIGIFLAVLARAVSDKLMMGALSWFAFILFVCWVSAFTALRVVPLSSTARQQLGCAVYFLRDCETLADKDAQVSPNSSSVSPALSPAVPANGLDPGKYKVFVQFAGVLQRDSVRAMMQQLKDQGWNVQGVSGGGQRTAAAAGLSEIRYPPGSEAAAKALAAVVESSKLSARPLGVAANGSLDSSNLEVWISR